MRPVSVNGMPLQQSDPITHPSGPTAAASPAAWRAELDLRFARDGDGATRYAHRRHHGPLRVQRLLYPEGADCAHAVLLHPPGGIAAGDSLDIALQLDAGARVLATTPGSAKWYRSEGPAAQQNVRLRVADGACLEWLPQESVLFDGAHARQSIDIELAPDAAAYGWDIVQLGRLAAGERWRSGHWAQRLALRRGARLCWIEQGALDADDALRASPLGFAGHAVTATAWCASPGLAADPERALTVARDAAAQHDLPCGVTWLAAPAEILVIRALGGSVDTMRALFEALWHTLRPCIAARPPQRPRLWST